LCRPSIVLDIVLILSLLLIVSRIVMECLNTCPSRSRPRSRVSEIALYCTVSILQQGIPFFTCGPPVLGVIEGKPSRKSARGLDWYRYIACILAVPAFTSTSFGAVSCDRSSSTQRYAVATVSSRCKCYVLGGPQPFSLPQHRWPASRLLITRVMRFNFPCA
jgi:hypothetical protein